MLFNIFVRYTNLKTNKIMEKEFIPYEQALALKELGFDEPCFFAFDNCSYPMRCTDLRTNEQKFNGVNYNSSSYTSQPTYSQAFRWFREKYGLCLVIKPIDDKKLELGYNLLKNGLIINAHTTYEEAELECLKKLIEIVKSK